MPGEYVGISEAAAIVGVSDATIRKWIHSGRVGDVIKQGRAYQIPTASLDGLEPLRRRRRTRRPVSSPAAPKRRNAFEIYIGMIEDVYESLELEHYRQAEREILESMGQAEQDNDLKELSTLTLQKVQIRENHRRRERIAAEKINGIIERARSNLSRRIAPEEVEEVIKALSMWKESLLKSAAENQ